MNLSKPLVLLPLVVFLRHIDLQRSDTRTKSEGVVLIDDTERVSPVLEVRLKILQFLIHTNRKLEKNYSEEQNLKLHLPDIPQASRTATETYSRNRFQQFSIHQV